MNVADGGSDQSKGAPPQAGSELESRAVPLRSASSPTVPGRAESSDPSSAATRPFVNDQLNSRLSRPISGAKWTIRWEAELNPVFPMSYILQAADRIVLGGPSFWQLFDLGGKSIILGKHGPGDILLDGKDGSMLFVDPFGVLEAHALADGATRYGVSITGGDEMQRSFFAKIGHRLVVASFAREINPHAPQPFNKSTLEVMDMGQPSVVQSEMLVSAKQERYHYFEAPRITAALLGDIFVAAVRGHLLVTNSGLDIRGNYTADFKPGALSLDESGRIYMLVNVNDRLAVWAITHEGERIWTYQFTPEQVIVPMPPAVDYAHRVFMHTADSVIAIGPDGKLLWEKRVRGPIAGLAVTTDDQTLVSTGSTLTALDPKGEPRTIQVFKDVLNTPPAMAANGDILVASSKRLYCLTKSPQ
jgi:hypothetical protein